MIEDCSVTNGMARAAKKMTEQPLKLIGIILAKHQEAILEVCKEQQDKIDALTKRLNAYSWEAENTALQAKLTEAKRLNAVALEALKQYTNVVTSVNDPNSWGVACKDDGHYARNAIKEIEGIKP